MTYEWFADGEAIDGAIRSGLLLDQTVVGKKISVLASFYDDYAHHPTEVNATITAAKTGWSRKIVSVFQPHLFTRTRDFYKEFAESLFQSNYIIITDIYPAREEPIKEISSQLIVKELSAKLSAV